MKISEKFFFRIFVLFFFISCYCCAPSLEGYNAKLKDSTVSGLSAGAFFAVQMGVAYSQDIKGVGVFAGGPYDCAQGKLTKALTECMTALPSGPETNKLISITDSRASQGLVGQTSQMQTQKVFLWGGTKDTTVHPPVMKALNKYYSHFVSSDNLTYIDTLPAAHTFPTDNPVAPNACEVSKSPYISQCNYDGAGAALKWIYGASLSGNRVPWGQALNGTIIEFDQNEFDATSAGLSSTGYVFVPAQCAAGQQCRLHVALHGCLQDYAAIGMDYVQLTGFNNWAVTNNLIILYPQVKRTSQLGSNPNACFDWWGYLDDKQSYDTVKGPQMKAVYKMMERVTSGSSVRTLPSPNNLRASQIANTSIQLSWSAVDGASKYNVARNQQVVGSVSTPLYKDTGLSAGTTYVYSVQAVASDSNQFAPSSFSTPINVTTSGQPPALIAPQLSSTSITPDSVTLSWTQVPGATSYDVWRDNNRIASQLGAFEYTDQDLEPNTQYSYMVAAVNAAQGIGPRSNTLDVTTKQHQYNCQQFRSSNYRHVAEDRAHVNILGQVYANGSNDYMGLYNIATFTTLSEIQPNYFILGTC